MAKHARVLLVTLAELDEKGADRHLLRIESVQVATLVAFLAGASEPVNAHLGLLLALVLRLHERGDDLLHLVDRDLGSLVRRVVDRASAHAIVRLRRGHISPDLLLLLLLLLGGLLVRMIGVLMRLLGWLLLRLLLRR